MHQRGDGTLGPTNLDTRYVLEDVPFGLVPTERLGRLAGAPAVLHESGINLLSAIYGRDFRAENDLLPALGLERPFGDCAANALPRGLAQRRHGGLT